MIYTMQTFPDNLIVYYEDKVIYDTSGNLVSIRRLCK